MAKKPEPGDCVVVVDDDGDIIELTVLGIARDEPNNYRIVTEGHNEVDVHWSESENAWVDNSADIEEQEEYEEEEESE